MEWGTTKPNRTGEDTISTFHYSYTLDVREKFPMLTCKRVPWKSVLFEVLWFLGGDNKVDWLHKHGVHFWDAWIENGVYLPEAYGKFWREYPNYKKPQVYEPPETCDSCGQTKWDFPLTFGDGVQLPYYTKDRDSIDQFKNIIEGLKKDPNNRRLILTNWYPPSARTAKLPPCHFASVFNTQYDENGEPMLCLSMTQRSCDVPVGVPFNIASYALLLRIVAKLTGIKPGLFGHTLVDAHIYKNQLEGVAEYLGREERDLPEFYIADDFETIEDLDELIRDGTTEEIMDTFKLWNYDPHPTIKFPVMV